MEPSLDDGEIVVQARRSAKVINMIQEFIHQASLASGQGCQMRNAGIEIPRGTSIAEDFKHSVTENQEARACGDLARPSRKIWSIPSGLARNTFIFAL